MPNYKDIPYHTNFLAGFSGLAGKPGGRVFWVGASGWTAVGGTSPSDGNNGLSPQTPFATIQKGLDACTSGRGDTVAVLPGSYTITAALTMSNDDVTLCSAAPVGPREWSPVVITAAAAYDLNVIIINANDCKVRGITVECGFAQVTASQEVVQVNNLATTTTIRGTVIENCYFHMGRAAGAASAADTDLDCIRVGLASNPAVDTVIRGCVIYAYDEIAIITTAGSVNCLIQNNLIKDGVASELGTGIQLAATGGIVDGNTILCGTTSDTVACVAVNVAAARAIVTHNTLVAWGADTCAITIINTATLFSTGNQILALAAGNEIDYKTDNTSPSMNSDFGQLFNSTPPIAHFVTPTIAGS